MHTIGIAFVRGLLGRAVCNMVEQVPGQLWRRDTVGLLKRGAGNSFQRHILTFLLDTRHDGERQQLRSGVTQEPPGSGLHELLTLKGIRHERSDRPFDHGTQRQCYHRT